MELQAGISPTLRSAHPAAARMSSQANAAASQIKKVGLEQAVKDINSGAEWKSKEMNVNVVDFKGVVLASSLNEKLRGKDTLLVTIAADAASLEALTERIVIRGPRRRRTAYPARDNALSAVSR